MIGVRRAILNSGWQNIVRQVPSGSVLYLPGLGGTNTLIPDYSGSANNGAITGATWGRLNSGLPILNFDGSANVVTVTDIASIQNIFATGGTVFGWIRPETDGGQDFGQIISKSDNTAAGWRLFCRTSITTECQFTFQRYWGAASGAWNSNNKVLDFNKFSFIAVTFSDTDVANDPTVYVYNKTNGLLTLTVGGGLTETATPVGAANTDVGQNLLIGNNSAGNRGFDGDEILWFASKTVLSAGTISGIIAQAIPLFPL